jgi:AbrB family looped-hinge helix DNA binding protein
MPFFLLSSGQSLLGKCWISFFSPEVAFPGQQTPPGFLFSRRFFEGRALKVWNFLRNDLLVRIFLLHGRWMRLVEASTTKVSSKGQVVIPANVRKAANLKKGEKILAIAIDETVVLKKIIDESFEKTMEPVWLKVRQMGLSEEDVAALIEEARAESSS